MGGKDAETEENASGRVGAPWRARGRRQATPYDSELPEERERTQSEEEQQQHPDAPPVPSESVDAARITHGFLSRVRFV